MGRIVTPTYRLEWEWYHPTHGVQRVRQSWNQQCHGRANAEQLARYVASMIESFKPGGVNYHVSESSGVIVVPHRARIVRQKTGEVVAEWEAPAFMAI
jgi:hypothetical protein